MHELKVQLQFMYLQYVNEFLTVERFAVYHMISLNQAATIISLGRQFHEERVASNG